MLKTQSQFEAWAVKNGFKIERRNDPASPDTYFRHETEQRWIVWQACAAAAPVEVAGSAVQAEPVLTPLDYRAQGREEVLAIILAQDPEEPFIDCTSNIPNGDAGDYSGAWDEDKLRALLHIGDKKHDAYDRAEAAYWDALGHKDEARREILFVEQAPFYKPLSEFLAKHEAWDLMADLKRVIDPAEPVGGALVASAEQEPFMWIDLDQIKRSRLTDYADAIEVTGYSVKFGHATAPLYSAPAGALVATGGLLLRLYERHKDWAARSGHAPMAWEEFQADRMSHPLTASAVEREQSPEAAKYGVARTVSEVPAYRVEELEAGLNEWRNRALVAEHKLAESAAPTTEAEGAQPEQLDEALANFLAEHTRLNQDGIDSHSMKMVLALNYAALRPVPEDDIKEWSEQGYIATERAAAPIPPESEVQAKEAKLYRDLTGEVMALGFDGLVAAVGALRERAAAPAEQLDWVHLPRFAHWHDAAGSGIAPAAYGEYVKLADVQALLATPRPADGARETVQAEQGGEHA